MWSSYQSNFSKLSCVSLIMIQLQVTIWVNQSTSQPIHQSTRQPGNPSPLSDGHLTMQSQLPQPQLDVNFITCETSPWRGRDEQWRYLTIIICVILDSSSSNLVLTWVIMISILDVNARWFSHVFIHPDFAYLPFYHIANQLYKLSKMNFRSMHVSLSWDECTYEEVPPRVCLLMSMVMSLSQYLSSCD